MITVEGLTNILKQGCEECNNPEHNHDRIVLGPRCHPGKGTDVVALRDQNYVEVVCHVCKSHVAAISVGRAQ